MLISLQIKLQKWLHIDNYVLKIFANNIDFDYLNKNIEKWCVSLERLAAKMLDIHEDL